jgi:hypothetical protein
MRFSTKLVLFLLLSVAVFAQSGITVPAAGFMLDHSGSLRAVTGIGQSFLVGDALRTGVLSAACARSLCLIKTAASVVTQDTNDAGTPAPAGPALFSIHNRSALVYFPAVNQFAHFEDSQLHLRNWSVDGTVLALRATNEGPQFAVRRGDGVWIIALDGSVLDSLPSRTVAVLLLNGVTLYSLPRRVVLRHADGSETCFDLPGAISFSQLGENYVQISTSSATYALRLQTGREQLSLLPDLVPVDASGVSQ